MCEREAQRGCSRRKQDPLRASCRGERRMAHLNRTDVINMPLQREQASPGGVLVVPDLDQVIVASGHKQRLLQVEIHATNGSHMLFVLLQQRLHLVVPQLNASIVQGGQNPRALRMEAQPLNALAPRLKLSQHGWSGCNTNQIITKSFPEDRQSSDVALGCCNLLRALHQEINTQLRRYLI